MVGNDWGKSLNAQLFKKSLPNSPKMSYSDASLSDPLLQGFIA